jgi:methylmalonyl-CoA/ethylmalonyl-CoA epimerase
VDNEPRTQSLGGKPLHHVGVVVGDIERAIAHLEALGFGPFGMGETTGPITVTFKGELHGQPAQWKTRVSCAKMGDVELELLEPYEGRQALRESLDANGEGLHHIGWLTTTLLEDVERQKALGAKIWTSSIRDDAPSFVYFEPTSVGGIAIELREPGAD